MHFAWTCALKDLRRLRRDPVMLLVWIGIPLFTSVMLSLVFGRGGGPTPRGRLLVADEDDSFISGVLTGGFSREPLSKMVVMETVPADEGRRRMNHGDASALLIVPKGFGDAFLQRKPSQITLITNPSYHILPGIIEETLSTMLDGGYYVQSWMGDQMDIYRRGPRPRNDEILSSTLAMTRIGLELRQYLNPLLIELETHVIEEKKQTVNYGQLFLPGMLFMSILFVGGGLSNDLWKEKAQGTLRRLAMTPGLLQAFLAGKLITASGVFGGLTLFGLLAGGALIGMPLAHLAPAVSWMIFSGGVIYLLLLLLTLHASSQRTANVLNNLVIMPLAMVGGAFFPFEVMPDNFARIGRLTPNGWALSQLKAILSGTVDAGPLVLSFAALAIAGAVAFLVAMRRLRAVFIA